MTTITLYLDIESPFSYLAYELLLRHEKAWKVDIVLKPVLLGIVLQATGNSPPAHVPMKGKYLGKDLRRKSTMYGIRFEGMPSNSRALKTAQEPYFSSMPGNRLALAAMQRYGSSDGRCRQLISNLYRYIMVERAAQSCILTDEVLQSVCRASGFSPDEVDSLMAARSTAEVKQALKTATDEAAHEGAFGVPYMCLEGPGISKYHRVWFGVDALYTIAAVLGKKVAEPTISGL